MSLNLVFQSEIEGKQELFGYLRDKLDEHEFCLGGYWDYDAQLQFKIPFVIKHVVNIDLDFDESSLVTNFN
ncbi:YugN family protein [Viridibacillus arvi]|uniref:YugN family protein n=1 Tax=Viridibacillus arvi TaxID=263475 RepID=UPI003CFC5B45